MFMIYPSVNSIMRNEAVMSRILAEDTLAAELRAPAPVTKKKQPFFRAGWLRKRSKSNVRCVCTEHRPASCTGC